jgi:hypothetical protein
MGQAAWRSNSLQESGERKKKKGDKKRQKYRMEKEINNEGDDEGEKIRNTLIN